MNKTSKVALILSGLGLVGYGLYVYFKNNALKLIEMTYRFQNLKVNKFTISDAEVSAEVVLTNPSDLSFKITGYDINVQFEGYDVARLQRSNTNIPIDARESTTIPFIVQFDPRQVGTNLYPLFLDVFVNKTSSKRFKVRYVGSISLKYGFLGFKNVPVDYTYEF
jgi:LEA14-like dessication related protein